MLHGTRPPWNHQRGLVDAKRACERESDEHDVPSLALGLSLGSRIASLRSALACSTQPEERYLNASNRSVTGVGTRSAAVATPLQIHVLDLGPT